MTQFENSVLANHRWRYSNGVTVRPRFVTVERDTAKKAPDGPGIHTLHGHDVVTVVYDDGNRAVFKTLRRTHD